MATFLFWNINKKPILDDIVVLCNENDVDILILAECEISEVTLLQALNKDRSPIFLSPFSPSQKLKFFYKYPNSSIRLVSDNAGVSIRHISPPVGSDIILVALHLPSKLHMSDLDQAFYSTRLKEPIESAETLIGHAKTLIIGDFNMNPFEVGIVAADGLHAVMDKQVALKQSRTVMGRESRFFYNPMWGRMGDTSIGPSGTYYYNHGNLCYFWNTFDQVLLRPDLLTFFKDDNLQVITNVGTKNLIAGDAIDHSVSDHLPIMITLELEKEG